MSCSLEQFVYPLKGFIRFEVEDIGTLGAGPWYSKSIKVGKTEWCISVTMECSDRTNNVTHLGIYLRNLYNFVEGESVKVKYSHRLLHEDISKIINYSFTTTYKNNSKSWGWNFIGKAELLNEGYVKNGTITIECDLEVLSETVRNSTMDFSQSRPNNLDTKAMLSVVNFEQKKKTIEVEFKVDEITNIDIYSHVFYVDGIECKVAIGKKKKEVEKLGLFLCFNSDDKTEWWRIEATVEFRIINRDDSTKFLSISFLPRTFSIWGNNFGNFFDCNEVFDLANGYVKYGRICIAVTVHIQNKYGFDEKTGKGIEKPMKKLTDAVITVEDTEFHVSRMVLSHQSSWFSDLFSNNPDKTEFSFSDDLKKYFTMFLQLVYNKPLVLDEDDLPSLLELLDKYQSMECIKRLDHQLIEMEIKDDLKMLKMIDKHGLPNMKARYVKKFQDIYELKNLLKDPDVVKLSDELRKALTLDETSMEKEDDKNPFYEYLKDAKTTEKVTDPRELFKNHARDNPEARKLLEDPKLQNIGNSVLSFLSKLSSRTSCQALYKEFSDPKDMITVKFTDDQIFYTSKQILANASEYFMKKYFGPDAKDDDNILICDLIYSLNFNTLMNHIYHPTIPVTELNLKVLLRLAHHFVVTDVLTKCEKYLIKTENLSVDQKEEYANKYNLKYLLSACKNYKEKK